MNDLIREISRRIKERYGAKEIILFGSYASGNAHEDSDIDLFVISDTNERFFERLASVSRIVRDLTKKIPFSPIVLTPCEIKDRLLRKDQFVEDILSTGIKV